jgi:hypothetical protein
MPYKFKRSDYDPKKKAAADIPAAGSIVAVEVIGKKQVPDYDWAGTIEAESKRGRPMFRVHVAVCKGWEGEGCWMLYYILLDNEWVSQNMGSLLDGLGFDMSDGVSGYNVTPALITGKQGYVRVKHEDYNGEPRPRIAYWISPSRYEEFGLEPLGEPTEQDEPERASEQAGGEQEEYDDDVPF